MYTLKEVKDTVLSLFDEYSVDGIVIGQSDNMDYSIRVPMLVNMLQMEWCRLVKIPMHYTITHDKTEALYTMPSDFMEINKIVKKDYYGYKEYTWIDRKTLKLLETDDGEYEVYYYKYPIKLTSTTADDFILDICDEASNIIPLKIASLLIKTEKAEVSKMLIDMYDDEKKMVMYRQTYEPQQIERVFSV